jgi:hypothetical protein
MIRKQTMLLWITSLVLTGIVVLFDAPWQRSSGEIRADRTLLPVSQLGTWEFVRVQGKEAQLEFQKEGTRWRMIEPLSDVAHPTLVAGLIESITRLKPKAILEPEIISREGGWSAFGLEPAQMSVIVGAGDREVTVRFGERESVGDQIYMRVDDQAEAWVVDAGWMDALPDAADAWRDTRIVGAQLDKVDRIEILQSEGPVIMSRPVEGGRWLLEAPENLKGTRANLVRIETLLKQSLPTWETQGFVALESDEDLQWMGLEDPVLELVLKSEQQEVFRVSFGFNVPDKPGLRYTMSQGRDSVLLAPERVFSDQLNQPIAAFRDAFLIDPGFTSNRILLKRDEPFTLSWDPEDAAWHIIEPVSIPTDAELVGRLHQNLVNITAKVFHDDVSKEQLENIFAIGSFDIELATMHGSEKTNSLGIKFSRAFGGAMYAQRTDESTLYELPASLLIEIPEHAIELRERKLWSVPVEEIVGIDILEKGVKAEFKQALNGVWMLDGDPLDDLEKRYMPQVLEKLSQPHAEDWVEAGDVRYEQFGLDPEGDRLQITVHFRRGEVSASKRILTGRSTPDSDVYVGVDLETGPVICEVSNALTHDIRQIQSWKTSSEAK